MNYAIISLKQAHKFGASRCWNEAQNTPIIHAKRQLHVTASVKHNNNKRAMLRSLGGGQIKKNTKTTAANLKALKIIIIIIK